MKPRIWKSAHGYVFGSYMPRLDGVKLWHFKSSTHWLEAESFTLLVSEIKRRGYL